MTDEKFPTTARAYLFSELEIAGEWIEVPERRKIIIDGPDR
jgi:hypothetical protein